MWYPLLRQLLFLLPPETVHYMSMDMLQKACSIPWMRKRIAGSFQLKHPKLEKELFGLHFPNPVGLGAGFDKNALYLPELEGLGFGSVEIGTVTPLPQPGNDMPRLFRLPASRALINRMGFNNNGVLAIRARLERWQNLKNKEGYKMIVGGNIGKNKVTANEDAWKDYTRCYDELADVVDYFTINVSSPNTPGLRALQEKDALQKIISAVQERNSQRATPRPILLKIAPDQPEGAWEDIADLAVSLQLSGLVVSNTTIDRSMLSQESQKKAEAMGAGGLSGLPVREKATDAVRRMHSLTGGQIPIIASGGIFTAADAREKLDAGAEMVQVWTGFVYEGPGIASKICRSFI